MWVYLCMVCRSESQIMLPDHPLVTNTFKGRRFDDHGLDLEVLPELVIYHRIVVETAKELWRKNNPEKQRLKKNIDEDYRLKIFNLEEGSVSVPIYRELPSGQLFIVPDELDEAVELVNEAIECVDSGRRIPENFPKNVIPIFANYGRTLQDDEYIEQKCSKTGRVARFTHNVREEFERLVLADYEDEFDIIAKVVMARVSKPKFAVLVHNKEVEAPFEDEFAEVVFKALESKTELQVRIVGLADFSADGIMSKIKRLDMIELMDSVDSGFRKGSVPFWERCQKLVESCPPETFENIPNDSVDKLDKYLYGTDA